MRLNKTKTEKDYNGKILKWNENKMEWNQNGKKPKQNKNTWIEIKVKWSKAKQE